MNRKFMFVFVALLALGALAAPGLAQDEVTISHYFSGELNQDNLNTIMGSFTEMSGIAVVDSPIGHEDFKTVSSLAWPRRAAGCLLLLGRRARAIRRRCRRLAAHR